MFSLLCSFFTREEEVEKEQEGPVELTSSPQAPVKPRWDKGQGCQAPEWDLSHNIFFTLKIESDTQILFLYFIQKIC